MRTSSIYFIFLLIWCLAGCISVNLPKSVPTKDQSVRIAPPQTPFESHTLTNSDAAWRNSKTGNIISYLSSCNDSGDPSMDALESELVQVFDNGKLILSSSIKIDGREGRKIFAEGNIDGVPRKIQAVILKKNRCIYHLTMAGSKANFDADLDQFTKFVEGFRVSP